MAWGEGRIFKRGKVFWIAYYCNGRECRESARTADEKQARKLLRERLVSTSNGTFALREGSLSYDDLEADIIRDYEINQRKSVERVREAQVRLRSFFRGARVSRISPALVRDYISKRKAQKAANATVNRELAVLRRMLRLAEEDGRIGRAPNIPMLSVNNARQGFVNYPEFEAICKHLSEDVRQLIQFLYFSAWRLGEARNLQWRDVDLNSGVILLRHEHSKNRRPRTLVIAENVKAVIEEARKRRRLDCMYVFHYNGHQMNKIYPWWHFKRACREAGYPAYMIHDLRRSAIRNMVRAGVPTNIVMASSGHLTDSVFRRYDIVSESDLADAQRKLAAYLSGQSFGRAQGN